MLWRALGYLILNPDKCNRPWVEKTIISLAAWLMDIIEKRKEPIRVD